MIGQLNKMTWKNKSKIIRDKLKDKIINDIPKRFETKIEKKKHNGRTIKNRIIRDTRALFEQEKEKDYYEPKRGSNLMAIKIETYHLMNILI